MSKKAIALPEHVITDEESIFSKGAKAALDAREQVNEFTAIEKKAKSEMTANAETLRSGKMNKGEVVGKIIITPPNQAAVRVEFNIKNGALDIDDLDNLDKLFGAERPELFETAEIVDKITDPEKLVEALRNAGLNPWDYLSLEVKPNQDQIIIDKGTYITTDEAILPKKGFLATLAGIMKHLSPEAKDYINKYLDLALQPKVVLGTKVKK